MMVDTPKPHRKYPHLYAILRYETDAPSEAPADHRVTVKKVVSDAQYAEQEVERLNRLNAGKGAFYFAQLTRFEEVPVAVEAAAPAPWAAAGDPDS